MKDSFSFMVSSIIYAFLALAGCAMISMFLCVGTAKGFHTNAIDRIQSSMYSEEVIQDCAEEAEKLGYKLTVEDVTIYEDRKDVKVTLEYEIPGWLFTDNKNGLLVGYAR